MELGNYLSKNALHHTTAPAFFYGIFFLLGASCAFAFHLAYLIPLVVCLWLCRAKTISSLLVFFAGLAWALLSYTLPVLPEEGIEGQGNFTVETLSYSHSPFQRSLFYKGKLKQFHPFTRDIPCSIYFNEKKPLPPASCSLRVVGRLIPKGDHRYVLKVQSWEPLEGTYSLAEWRFKLKNKLRSHLTPYFPDSKCRAFLLSMLTGEIDDRLLALEFNRLGILHLLGISGFQFTLLAFLIGIMLRFIMPYRLAYLFLLILLSVYAFALGDSPPIERAWIGSLLYLSALLCGFRISALNALGVALGWQLIKDPLLIFHLGFQFSFLCTAAILMVYPHFRTVLHCIFPKRSFGELLQLSFLDQHGHLLSFFCRETLALNAAIHFATLPLIMYHFHKFPLLSLLYNLFLPAAVSLVYLLLIFGLSLPYVGSGLLVLSGKVTEGILKVATHPPALYDFQWRLHDFPIAVAVTAITAIFYWSLGKNSSARSIDPAGVRSR